MIRDKLIAQHETVDGFRWRSHEIARIEGFSDAVFGFAVTLLIVSLEVPRTSTELFETMRGFGGFVATFTTLAGIWYAQFLFFRRYGLEDKVTVVLNLALLFTVLFFVYPMKFLFNMLITDPLLNAKVETAHGLVPAVLPEHQPLLFLLFGLGMGAVFAVFLLLYRHAYRQREALGLNELEVFETRHSMQRQILSLVVAGTYFGLAGVHSLPHHTRGQKFLALGLLMALAVVFIVLSIYLYRASQARKSWMRDWHARSSSDSHPHP